MQNQKYIDHTIEFTNNKIHKYTIIWRKTQITLLIVEERITNQLSDPASKTSSPHEKQDHPIIQRSFSQINQLHFLTNYKFQPPDLLDEGSIYRCLARV